MSSSRSFISTIVIIIIITKIIPAKLSSADFFRNALRVFSSSHVRHFQPKFCRFFQLMGNWIGWLSVIATHLLIFCIAGALSRKFCLDPTYDSNAYLEYFCVTCQRNLPKINIYKSCCENNTESLHTCLTFGRNTL